MPAKPVPDRYHTVTPYLVVEGAALVLDFAGKVFGAKEVERMTKPDGTVAHAEVLIGDSVVMISDATERSRAMPGMLYVYVPDVDATYQLALHAGATPVMEPTTQFYGDRHGGVRDAAGNQWWIATHVEDVSPAELRRRSEAAFKKGATA
jgi:PhnB protein